MSNIQNILDKLQKKYPLSESISYKIGAPFILRIPKLDLTLPIYSPNPIYYLINLINTHNEHHKDDPIKITGVGRAADTERLGYGSMVIIDHTDVVGLGRIMDQFVDVVSKEYAYKKYAFIYLNEYCISSETIDTALSEFQDFEIYLKHKLPEDIKILTSVVEEDEFNKTYIMSIMLSGMRDTQEEAEKLSMTLEVTIDAVIETLQHINFQYPKVSNYL